MSKKDQKRLPQQPEAFPQIAAPYVDTYRYQIDNGVFTIWVGRAGAWHAAFAMPLHLAVDLHQKLGGTIATTLRQQDQGEPPPAQDRDVEA